ncbi:MAG TPA: glycosyltransferase family 4 protein [Solirubrobacteraceae bacterium]|jgi:glycosyltransferase involved in cell wall biosynthesis
MSSKRLRILIFHGYLLGGTGSNVYNAQLAEALVALGHEVHLVCQDRHPESHRFVEAAGDWDTGRLELRSLSGASEPRCTVYRPNIGTLLPVYVHDRYEGFEAKTFADCTDAEVERYVEANVAAVREVVAHASPQLALANHLVMGPAILARALEDVPYAVKVHGSALEYTVKREPKRFLPYAEEGVAAANAVLAGSRHTAESLWEALGERFVAQHDLTRRTRLGPPGVDVHRFQPRSHDEAASRLAGLVQRLEAAGGEAAESKTAEADNDAFVRQEAEAAVALASVDPAHERIVGYVGKLIVSKGVDLLLAAWPLVLIDVPSAKLVIVGFGGFREGLERMLSCLASGDLDAVAALAAEGRALEGGRRAPLRHLLAFLDTLQGDAREAYLQGCASLASQVTFTGRLDHAELVDLLPACEALVVPSTFPEAFGMVAAEAAACGALPISAAHSGLAEVSEALAAAVPAEVAGLLSFQVDDRSVRALAERVVGWLQESEDVRADAASGVVETVGRLWSWEGVAMKVIAAAEGDVEAIPPIPAA